MSKLDWFVPTCITSGPIFMSGMSGLFPVPWRGLAVVFGLVLMIYGLIRMLFMISEQQQAIDKLKEELRILTQHRGPSLTH